MAIDFTRYQKPGVYTEDVGGPQLSVMSSVPTAVAIFGRAVGHQKYRESLIVNPDTGEITTVQLIQVAGAPASGSFILKFDDVPTGPIPFDASPEDVQAALEALANIGPGNVVVTGIPGGPWTVTFAGELAGETQPLLEVDDSGLGGGSAPNISVLTDDLATPAINRTLAKKGIITDSIKVVNPITGFVYHEGRDYVVHRIAVGADVEIATRDDEYTIVRVVEGEGYIEPGDTVQVAYNYTDTKYHQVYALYDYDDVRDLYGEPFDANGNVQSEITLCAEFAMMNGASTVLTCAIDPVNPNSITIGDYGDALDKFRDEEQIAIIVPGTGSPQIQALVQQHVVAQSNNRYERRAVIGIDGTKVPVESDQRVTQAQSLTERRIALISPASFEFFAPELNRPIVLGGQYVAAAVAGKSVSMLASWPLTNKTLMGFVGPAENQREGEKSRESSQGLMVVERSRRNLVLVRHGVTTNPTDLLTREWSIIGQQDVMVYRIRDYLEADGLIGMPIYDTTLIQVKASAEAALQSLVANQIIVRYQNLKVRQIAKQPDVIEVRYEWLPAYPLNYIVVRYSVAVLTGDVTIVETTA